RRDGARLALTPGVPRGREVVVPGDISSAAFFLAAAAAIPGSAVTVDEMGATLEEDGPRSPPGEPVASLTVRGRRLRGVTIGGALIPRVIDELPVLSVIAAAAEGRTVIRDAAELRVKESDRIAALARGLRARGAQVEERPDGMEILGGRLRGGTVDAGGDHRVAMAFAVAGLLADGPVTVRGAEA